MMRGEFWPLKFGAQFDCNTISKMFKLLIGLDTSRLAQAVLAATQ